MLVKNDSAIIAKWVDKLNQLVIKSILLFTVVIVILSYISVFY